MSRTNKNSVLAAYDFERERPFTKWVSLKSNNEMGWASHYIEKLIAGETVLFRPRGNSMAGKIESGQLCTVTPVEGSQLAIGDIVLCKVKGHEYLHLVKAIQGEQFQIGNNKGRINGWVSGKSIYGRCVNVEA